MPVQKIKIKQKEAKIIQFTVTDDNGFADMSNATLTFVVRGTTASGDRTILFTISDGSFDKTNAATGVVKITITATNSDQTVATYVSDLKIEFSSTNIDKSPDIPFIIQQAQTD